MLVLIYKNNLDHLLTNNTIIHICDTVQKYAQL